MSNLSSKYNINLKNYSKVTWKTQESDSKTVLFYSLGNNEKALSTFHERLKNANYGICFVNRQVEINSKSIITVDGCDWLPLQKEVCNTYYPIPSSLKSIAVTGTNGKTTTIDLIRQICVQKQVNVLTIGTLGVWLNNELVNDFGLTSPAYIDFRKFLFQYSGKFDVLAVEVSSHALEQQRYYDFDFDYGAWTSFSQDHLDYHLTIKDYYNAKMKIFNVVKNKVFIIQGESFAEKISSEKCQFVESSSFETNPFLKISYNRKNMSLAMKCLEALGVSCDEIDYDNIISPAGRFNIVPYKESFIVIDFAHTPEALENICKEIKRSFQGYDLITIFGCGGDRDKTKRPLMGKVAIDESDFVIITSDNPRFEDPNLIINDITLGLNKSNYQVIVDRKEAIKVGFTKLDKTILLIAGKGHEAYIDQNGTKRAYSDLGEVNRNINND